VTRIGISLIGVLLAAAAPAFAAPADSNFAAFVQICADTQADYPAVVAAADAQGWRPAQVNADTLPGVTVTDTLARDKNAGGATLALYAWQGAKGAVHVSECKVRIGKAKSADMQTAAQTWLGFAPQQATAKKATFEFTDDGGAHKALTTADREAAAAGAGMQILTVTGDQDGVILDILKIKK
jgi:hypothetical protein